MSTTVRPRTRGSSSYHSFQDYSYTDDSDGSYTIEDISGVLDPHNTAPTPATAKPPLTPKSGMQYGGRGRRRRRPTAANSLSMFRDIHSPLFLRRTLTEEKVSDSIISVDEDIVYHYDDDNDDCGGESLEERPLDVRRLDLVGVRTDAFRRFSPCRIGVKLLSSRLSSQNKTSGASKTKVKSRKRSILMKILFPNKYGCLTKELD